MIVIKKGSYNASRYAHDQYDNSDIINNDTDVSNIITCLSGRVRFGSGVTGHNGENISGQFLTITTNVTLNTETTFTHTIGAIPVGYIVLWQDKAGSLYQGPTTGTAWTINTISLKCSVASVQFKLFLLM